MMEPVSTRHSRTGRRTALALACVGPVAAALLTGCGNDPASEATDPAATGTVVVTPPTAPSDEPSTDREDDVESGGPSAAWLLAPDDLPAGWRNATGNQQLGVPAMCGVTLEPPALSSASTRRYTKAWDGPFVMQYSFVSDDEPATKARMREWVRAARSCTSSEVEGDPVSVEPLTGLTPVGTEFAAVRVEATKVKPGTPGAAREYVAFRDGNQVTVLISFSLGDLAPRSVLEHMVRRIGGF